MANWHNETMAKMKNLSIESLYYIYDDANKAAEIGEKIGNPKSGQYRDEAHYAAMEIKARK
tara:strand:+ start:706 stop:888 length:183 start_codon:yes stop_codon:yes gene_type:complete